MKRIITRHTIATDKVSRSVTFALISDLHNGPWQDLIPALGDCDAILIAGDMPDRHHPGLQYALPFLTAVSSLKPVFYTPGNHEWKSGTWPILRDHAMSCGIHVLDNTIERFGEISIGGFSACPVEAIDTDFPNRMSACGGFRLMLCHHPEWYRRYVAGHGIDLTFSGHAHGGQIQLFGHGLYAPGQGILPRYTHGWYDDRHLLVGRGLTNSCGMPRWGNPCELILLTICPKQPEN